MSNSFIKGYITGALVMLGLAVLLVQLSGCATGPLCTGTEEEVKQCQEQMARARENRMEALGNRR